MSKIPKEYGIDDGLFNVFISVVFAIIPVGIVAFLFTGLASGWGANPSAETPAFITSFIVLLGGYTLFLVISDRRKKRNWENYQEAQRIESQVAAMAGERSEIIGLCSQAARDFESLLWYLTDDPVPAGDSQRRRHRNEEPGAGHYYRVATEHYANGEFAPFWDAVEGALTNFGEFHRALERISQSATSFSQQMSQYVESNGWPDDPFVEYPIGPDAAAATEIAVEMERDLSKLAYTAQGNQGQPAFSAVWEERRNTRVWIAGSNTLGEALSRMGGAITSATEAMSRNIETVRAGESQADGPVRRDGELTSQVEAATRELQEIANARHEPQRGYRAF